MLSKAAFNGLLKTLEEPPAHVKFLFATTEVNKVPVTVLSRCQRFDLKRIPADLLARHFAHVTEAEHVEAEAEALALIARAAEGSVRDGLSILDQAIAHADLDGEGVKAAQVRDMLGLSDRGAIRRLFAAILAADVPGVLQAVEQQDALGVEPAALLRGLLEVVHGVTRAKAGGAEDPALAQEEREAFGEWASRMGFATLHRLWQLLLKGHGEVLAAPHPREAAEMALLRVVHASQLPDPGELARRLQSGETTAATAAPVPTSAPTQPAPSAGPSLPTYPETFEALVRLVDKASPLLGQQLHDFVGLVRYAPPELALRPIKPVPGDFARQLAGVLKTATDSPWDVEMSDAPSEPSLLQQEQAAAEAARNEILNAPMVAAVRSVFPNAELIEETRSLS
jgi:DNA polymerase-3 subunit gamma/tau